MIDTSARMELAANLRRLVAGEMTNDEFDDRHEDWIDSEDAGVAEIARFGWSLYSDFFTYSLIDRHAIDDATRRTADRAILFFRASSSTNGPGILPRPSPSGLCSAQGFTL